MKCPAVLIFNRTDGRRTWHPLDELALPDDVVEALRVAIGEPLSNLSFYLVDDRTAVMTGLAAGPRIVIAADAPNVDWGNAPPLKS